MLGRKSICIILFTHFYESMHNNLYMGLLIEYISFFNNTLVIGYKEEGKEKKRRNILLQLLE